MILKSNFLADWIFWKKKTNYNSYISSLEDINNFYLSGKKYFKNNLNFIKLIIKKISLDI